MQTHTQKHIQMGYKTQISDLEFMFLALVLISHPHKFAYTFYFFFFCISCVSLPFTLKTREVRVHCNVILCYICSVIFHSICIIWLHTSVCVSLQRFWDQHTDEQTKKKKLKYCAIPTKPLPR